MLDVVDDQQELSPGEPAAENREWVITRVRDAACPGDCRDDELCVAQSRELDEHDTVGEGVPHRMAKRDRESRLAAPTRADERDKPDVRTRDEGRKLRQLAPSADERRHGMREIHVSLPLRSTRSGPELLTQNRRLEGAELGARLEPELVRESLPCRPVGGERVCLPARPVVGEHELGSETLAQGMLRDEPLEFGDDVVVAAESEIGGDPFLDARDPKLLEATHLRPGELGIRGVGKSRAAPKGKCSAQESRSELRVAGQGLPAVCQQGLEPVDVECAGGDPQEVPGGERLQGAVTERPAELRDVELKGLPRRGRRRVAPHGPDQPVR